VTERDELLVEWAAPEILAHYGAPGADGTRPLLALFERDEVSGDWRPLPEKGRS